MAWRDPWDTVDRANALRGQQEMQGIQALSALQGMQTQALQRQQVQNALARDERLRSILSNTDPSNPSAAVPELWRGGFLTEANSLRDQASKIAQQEGLNRFFGLGQPATSQPRPGSSMPGQPVTPQQTGNPLDELDPQSAAVIRGMAASGDSKGALEKLFTALQPKLSSDGRAVVTRGGRVLAAPGAVEAFKQFQEAQKSTEAQFGNPVEMPTSDGRTVRLFPNEFENFRRGILPERLGGPATGFSPEQMALIRKDAAARGQPNANTAFTGPDGQVTRSTVPVGQIGVSPPENVQQANTDIAKRATALFEDTATKARSAAETIGNIDRARGAIAGGAFMGAGAEYKLSIAKFANDVLGIPLDPQRATQTNYLKSLLGQALLDKAKALGSNPSNTDAQRINDIVGSLSTDRNAMGKILDWQEEMARKAISTHQQVRQRIEANDYSGAISVGTTAPPRQQRQGALPSMQDIDAELERRRRARGGQ